MQGKKDEHGTYANMVKVKKEHNKDKLKELGFCSSYCDNIVINSWLKKQCCTNVSSIIIHLHLLYLEFVE